jgi:glycosyltransferase involved in cell wall biosynthesis
VEAITIVVPNYNKGRFLAEAIDSLLRQDDPNWRAIILDDGSNDDSRSLLQSYAPLKDPRFTVHFNDQRKGKAYCMNRLVERAETDIIGELDSDDALADECVKEVLQAYRASDSGFVYTNFTYCNGRLTPIGKGYCAAIPEGRTAMELDCVAHFCSFRKAAFLEAGGLDETLFSAVDKDLICRLEEVTTPYFVDRELYFYRMLRESLSTGPEATRIAKQNHEIVKAKALARRNGDPRAVRLARRCV